MTSSGRCHGPGCTREVDGDFCGEECSKAWQLQHADPLAAAAATVTIEWLHPLLGGVVEYVCETHEKAVLQALKALGIGCSGRFADASTCLRCVNEGRPARAWLPSCVVTDTRPSPAFGRTT